MVKPYAPTASGGIGSGLSANTVPLPTGGGSGSFNPSRNLRPYGQIGKANAGFFTTSVPPRMDPITGSFKDPEMIRAQTPERAPFADVPILGQITQGVSSFLGSSLVGDALNPQHMITRTKVWEEGIEDPERAKWQRMVDTNSISLADAQARFLRETYAKRGDKDLFLDIEAPGDNSFAAQMASKLVAFTSTGQRIMQKSGVGATLGPVTVGGRNWKDRLTELDSATDAQLENNEILIDIRDAHKAGELDDSRTMDQLIVAGFGTQNPTLAKYGAIGPLISLAEELTTDPISLLEMGTGFLAKAATITAAQSAKWVAREAGEDLVRVITKRMYEKGYSFGRRGVDHMLIREMMSSPDTLEVLEKAMTKASPVTRFLVMDAPRIHTLGTKINMMLDPLSFFGRDEIGMLATKSFSNKAAMGVIDGFGARNVRAVRAVVGSELGEEAASKVDEAFDVAGMNVTLQVGADHSIAHVRGSQVLDGFEGSTVNEIAMGNARRMGGDLRRVVADKTDRIRLRFVPLESGKQGTRTMMGNARARATSQLANMTGVDEAAARRVVDKLSEEQLSILDFQHYGKVINDFANAREAAQQAGEQIAGNEARRATFLGPRQLTRQGFAEFREAVKKKEVAKVREMIEDYDSLYAHFSLDMPDKELMDLVTHTLDQIEKQLPTEIVDMATVPAALRSFFDQYSGMGYRLGLMPSDEDLMRPIMRDGRVVSINPWVDFVNERLARKNVSRYMVTREMLFRSISGATVIRDAQVRFVRLGAERLGLSAAQSNEMFRAIQRTANEANVSPRGLDAQSMWDAVWKADLPVEIRTRISERNIAELVLEAHEGSLKYVGASQKFTGMAKTALFKVSGTNYAGALAENIYPKLRFTLNPMFQAMEFVETPILLLLRGYLPVGDVRAAFTKAGRDQLMDEIERTHLVMDILQKSRPTGKSFIDSAWEYTNSFIRASERVINAALAERGMTTRMGDIFGRYRPNVHAVKRWGEARSFEYRMADEMMGSIAGASPESWSNYATWLMQRSRYNNDRTAVRHFLYDIVARGNPEAAYARLGPNAFKPEHLGAQARIMPQFIMSLTEGQEAASGLKWADYRKRVRDPNDALTVGQVEDALREVQADPHYTQRVLDSLTAPSPKEFYESLKRLGRPKEELNALRRRDRKMAEELGIPWDEYISTRYAQAPGTVDSMGNITNPTLFQQIADASERRGMKVLSHDSPERIEMSRIATEWMDGVTDAPPPGVLVKDLTPEQAKRHSYQQARVQRAANPAVGLPPRETIRPVTGREWPVLKNQIRDKVTALRAEADVKQAEMLPASAFETRRAAKSPAEIDAVTEMVPVSVLREFMTENREAYRKAGQGATSLDALTEDMRKNPVNYPLTLQYDPVRHQVMMADGNTRLAAALRLDMEALPVVVVSTGPTSKVHYKMKPVGSGTAVESVGGEKMLPSRIGLETVKESEAAKKVKSLRHKADDIERRLIALQEAPGSDAAARKAIQSAYDEADALEEASIKFSSSGHGVEQAKKAKLLREEGQRLQRLLSAEGASGSGGNIEGSSHVVTRNGRVQHRFGPIEGKDWWEQLRNVLGEGSDESPKLRELADWYHDMRRGVLALAHNDPHEAARLLVGFGVSQLNTSPHEGMRFLLRADRMQRVGKELPIDKRVTGLNSALLKSLLEDETITEAGLGQKLMDFIDSLIGKERRSAGIDGPDINNPWQPVAGDIWAKRDLGYTDAKMTSHIAYMYGVKERDVLFDKDIGFIVRQDNGERLIIPANKITGGSPSEVEYDHIVEFYNARRTEANERNWLGRNDWTAAEMQAVGWFRAKTAMGDDTGSPLDAIFSNRHNVTWESVPSVTAPLGEQFPFQEGAARETVQYVTERVGRHVAQEAEAATGVRVIAHFGSNGPWVSKAGNASVTPNMVFEVASGDVNDVYAFTAAMAYLTQQEGIPASRLMPAPDSGPIIPKPSEGQLWAVDWAAPEGTITTKAQVEAALDQLVQSNAIIKSGASVVRYDDGSYGIRAVAVPGNGGLPESWWGDKTIPSGKFKAAWTDEMIGGSVDADGASFVPQRVTVESQYHYHDWKADPSGQGILDELRKRGYGSTADQLERGARSRTRLVYEHAYQRADPNGLAKWRAEHAIDDPVYEQRAGALFNADLSDDDVIARSDGAIKSGDLLFQRAPRGTLGAVSFDATDRHRASLFLNARGQRRDTLIHELSHQFAEQELDPSAKVMLLDIYNAAVGNNTLTRRGRTPGRNAAGRVPATAWNEDVHEWFADQFVAWMRTGDSPSPLLEPLMQYYSKYLKRTTSYAGVLSPEVKSILDELAKRPITRAAPYNTDEAALFAHAWGAATRAQRRSKDLVYFKTNRSWLERSLNHPYFGMYPLSYMWGKILPDLLNFLMFKPFGFEAPFAAFNVAYRMYRQTLQQTAYDEEMQNYLKDNEPALRALAMFIPGLPWDLPANAPLYMRRIVEALATQDAKSAAGEMRPDGTPYEIDPTKIDYGRIMSESLGYAFGPYKGVESLIDSAQGAATMGNALASDFVGSALPVSTPQQETAPLVGEPTAEPVDQGQPPESSAPLSGSGLPNTQPPVGESPTTTILREEMTDAQTQLEQALSGG